MKDKSFVLTSWEVLLKAYKVGPIFPLPLSEKKLDFSPSLVEIYSPIRKITGTATNRRLATKPKLVVSIKRDGNPQKLSLKVPLMLLLYESLSLAVAIFPKNGH